MYNWLLRSHISEEYTALEKPACLVRRTSARALLYMCLYVCVCVCDVCMYLSVISIGIQSSSWTCLSLQASGDGGMKLYDKRVIALSVSLHNERC